MNTIDFDATMTYREIMELVDYLEGGTRKVKITNLKCHLWVINRQMQHRLLRIRQNHKRNQMNRMHKCFGKSDF